MSSHWLPAFDELKWVIQIKDTIEEMAVEDDGEVPVSVFNVPKALMEVNPDAFVPQLIALGPYHHWRPELYDMERYKLSAAKRTQKFLVTNKFQDLVDSISKHEQRIRSTYHRFLDFNDETLAWMMAVDACFLLEFLQIYFVDESGRVLKRISSKMSHLVDLAGRKSAHNIILRDIMMLENQIPIFLLKKILDEQKRALPGDVILTSMVTGFIKEISPFKMLQNFPTIDVLSHAHLLEILYYVLVPTAANREPLPVERRHLEIEEHRRHADEGPKPDGEKEQSTPGGEPGQVKQLCTKVWGIASKVGAPPALFLKKAAMSKPVMFLVKAPWKLLTALPGVSALAKPVEVFLEGFGLEDDDGGKKDDGEESCDDSKKTPLVEEIMVPSVEQLIDSGVLFRATNGDLTSIAFDPKTFIFYLPTVTLDLNSEVVLRNLVAYESSVASGPLVFTRYTELMNGIIDSEEDVKLLRQKGIIMNHMKSDRDVADLWNGMSKSVRLSKVHHLDKTIEDVNKFYNSRWRVKTQKFMKRYIFGSWPFLTFIAAIVMLALTALEAFCSVYTCTKWFGAVVTEE